MGTGTVIVMKTLVLGIGNTLLTDEGVGVHVVRALREAVSAEDVECMDGGTLSFTLAVPIGEAEALVVVDAAQLGGPPGAIRLFEGEDMDRFLLGHRRASAHEVGLADLMRLARLSGRWPVRRALLAIQPEDLDWGEVPTPRVAAAIPEACRRITALLEDWRRAT